MNVSVNVSEATIARHRHSASGVTVESAESGRRAAKPPESFSSTASRGFPTCSCCWMQHQRQALRSCRPCEFSSHLVRRRRTLIYSLVTDAAADWVSRGLQCLRFVPASVPSARLAHLPLSPRARARLARKGKERFTSRPLALQIHPATALGILRQLDRSAPALASGAITSLWTGPGSTLFSGLAPSYATQKPRATRSLASRSLLHDKRCAGRFVAA